MKKVLLVSALALFGAVNAQVKYGLKAGYNLSNVGVSSSATSVKAFLGSKSGFNAGAFVEAGLGNNFSLQGEVLYSNVGTKLKVEQDGSAVDLSKVADLDISDFGFTKANATLSMSQIAVPVSLKYRFGDKFSVLGGASMNFQAGVKTKVEVDGNDVKPYLERELGAKLDDVVKDQLSTINFGLHLGAEYQINNNVFVDARYNFGISNLNRDFSDYVKVKQRYLQLGLGYKF